MEVLGGPSEAVLKPGQAIDFAVIGSADTATWTVHQGPAGTLSVRTPPTWSVTASPVIDSSGAVIGDQFQIRKPDASSKLVDHGVTATGWLEILISTQPFSLGYEEPGGDEVTRKLTLPNSVPPRSGKAAREFSVTQYEQNTRFAEDRGSIVFHTSDTTGSLYLNIFASVHFDASAEDVASVRAVIESAEVLK